MEILNCLILLTYASFILRRNVCFERTSLTPLFMSPGRVPLEWLAARAAANAGTLLSTVRNVQLPCPLKVSYT